MELKLVTYFPEGIVSQNKKFPLLKKRLLENSTNKIWYDATNEWIYKGNHEQEEACQCICTTPIINWYMIHNNTNCNMLKLGSCCIKKFLPDAVKCKNCDSPLKNITQRLIQNKLICITCKNRELKRIGKFKFYIKGNYYNCLFKDLIKNDVFLDYIININSKYGETSYDAFINYIHLKGWTIEDIT